MRHVDVETLLSRLRAGILLLAKRAGGLPKQPLGDLGVHFRGLGFRGFGFRPESLSLSLTGTRSVRPG